MNPSYQRAMILREQGRHADAASELRQVLANDPHDAMAHTMLALCLSAIGKHVDATDEARAAVGLAPELPLSHYALAQVMYTRNFYDEAAAAISEAIALDPFQSSFHGLHGFILFERNKFPLALEAAEHGLAIDPEDDFCTNLRAMALVKLGRKDEASATIHGALQKDPENALSHANQGWTFLHRGDPKQAMVHFTEALRLDPTLDWARAGMVEALKARNFIYRWMLRWFLFMSRLNRKGQWGIVVGGYVGYRLALQTAQTNPALAPYLWPLVIAYIAFALLSWLADPLFNLLLRLHPQGKFALSRDQRVGANCVAIVLAIAIGALVFALVKGNDLAVGAALMLVLYLLPITAIFKTPQGWPRWTMIGATALLGLMMAGSLSLEYIANRMGERGQMLLGLSMGLFYAFLYGVLIASFGAGWLISVRPKK